MEDDEEEDDTIPDWCQGGAFADEPMEEDYEEWERIKDHMMLSIRRCERQMKITGKR
jgi:hypothetical protein